MTPEEITTNARRIALNGITEEIQDVMGLGEQLEDAIGDVTAGEFEEAVAAVGEELKAIRAALAEEWGMAE
jgi:hypothetical protein